jgi:hypothetical protein
LRGLGLVSFELRLYRDTIQYLQQALDAEDKRLQGTMRAEAESLLERARTFVSRLVLNIKPSRSLVLIDGEQTEVVSRQPTLLDPGEHTVEVRSEGYQTHRLQLTLHGGETQTIVIELVAETVADATAHRPSGATEAQDAQQLYARGVSAVKDGRYDRGVLALELAMASSDRPLDGAQRNEAQRLQEAVRSRVGRLELHVRPPEADVAVDGERQLFGVGHDLVVMPGSHVLAVSAAGFEPQSRKVVAQAGRSSRLEFELAPLGGGAEATNLFRNGWFWSCAAVVTVGAVVGGLAIAGKFSRGAPYAGTTGRTLPVGE